MDVLSFNPQGFGVLGPVFEIGGWGSESRDQTAQCIAVAFVSSYRGTSLTGNIPPAGVHGSRLLVGVS